MAGLRCSWLALVLFGAGCGQDGPGWEGQVLEEGGVLTVENPVDPLGAPGTVSAGLLWRSSGPSDGDVWEAPRQIHVGEDVVYLVDRQAGRIHRLSLEGEVLPSLGEPGQGPGQYGRLVDAIPASAGLFVVDAGNGRVELLDDRGTIRESVLLDQYVFSAVPFGQDAIAVFGALGRDRRWQRIDAQGRREVFEFPELDVREGTEAPPSRAATWGNRLVHQEFRVPRIWVYSPDGELEMVVHVPLPEEVTPEGELNRMAQGVADVLAQDGVPAAVIQQQVDEMKASLRIKSRFRDVCFDDGAGLMAILEQNPEDFGAGPATLHLLSSEGIYLAVLPFREAWADFDLKDGTLFALARDPITDLVTLQVYRLEIPQSLLARGRALASQGP